MIDGDSGAKTDYSQEDIDALAYSYVLTHGYEGALAMFAEFMANRSDDGVPDDALTILCRRIRDAIHDEAATISRILDRMITTLHNGAHQPMTAITVPGSNLVDRHIGLRLRQRRYELGLSLTALAAGLALTPDALASIEEGGERLDAAVLERAVKRLGVPTAYFFQTLRPDEDANGASQSLTT